MDTLAHPMRDPIPEKPDRSAVSSTIPRFLGPKSPPEKYP